MVSPQKIKYNGVFSDTGLGDLDIIFDVAFESDNGAMSSYLNRSAVASESHDGRYKNTARYKYDELFSPQFTIVKKDFSDFTQEQVRRVLKYLTSTDRPSLLEVYYDGDSNVVDWACIGGWTNIETYKIANSRTVGIVAQFEAITPYAMSALVTKTKTVSTPTNTTMYRWTPTKTASSTGAVPSYFLTSTNTLSVGTSLYTFTGDASTMISKDVVSSYGNISAKSGATYTAKGVSFTVSTATAVTVQDMSNKIVIDINTDDNKPVYPCITINHGYNPDEKSTTAIPHPVISLPFDVTFSSIVSMANYVEDTIYHNATTNKYYYKSYNPVFTSGTTLPQYVNWTIVEVERAYTSADTFAANTFYYYAYEGKYYWKVGTTFYTEVSLPTYGDWKTKSVTKAYTANDTYEDKTIYAYTSGSTTTYYWMSPANFYESSTQPSLSTTSVKITNQHYDVLGSPSTPVTTIIKHNTTTEKIVVDGANKLVSSSNTRRIFGDDFNWTWLPLYDGKNEITIEGNCEVTIEYRTVIKCGEY